MPKRVSRQPTKYASGWFNHTRSSCNWRKQCLLQEDHTMSAMSDRALRDHLIELGLFDPEEKKRAEEKKALRGQSSGTGEVRSVSVSEEPDRKKQKKEKKEEEKRKKEGDEKRKREEDEAEAKKREEDAKKKKEAADLRSLQSESDIVLHGYLFDETFRCETQKSLMKQAKYEQAQMEAAASVMKAAHGPATALGGEPADKEGRSAAQVLEDPAGMAQAARWRSGTATGRMTSMLCRMAQILRGWVNGRPSAQLRLCGKRVRLVEPRALEQRRR